MDKLDEVVVIDGVEYTQRELDVLRGFAGRKTIGPSSENKLKAFLGLSDSGNEDINKYLATGTIPGNISSREELQVFLSKIETLYSIACKYGASHTFPKNSLFREEEFYYDIVGNYDYRTDTPRKREWVSEAFKSFSNSRGESGAFSKGEFDSHKVVVTDCDDYESKKIPFIDVNKLLGRDHVFAGESEILLPPYQMFIVSPESSIVARNPRDFTDPSNDFEIKITQEMRNPYTLSKQKSDGEDVHTYSSKDFDVSDAELELIVELNNRARNTNSPLTPEEETALSKLTEKLRAYTMTRCKSIYKIQMEHPLIVGKYITPETASRYGNLLNSTSSLRKQYERIYTKEDLARYDYNYMGSYSSLMSGLADYRTLKNYKIIDKAEGFSPQIINNVLNSGHRAGNREMIRALAQKGLILDEVLAFDGKITPKGLENLSYLNCLSNPQDGRSKPVLLSELEKRKEHLGIDIFHSIHTSIYDLERKGFTILRDDDEKTLSSDVAKESLSRIGRTRKTSEIAKDYGKFVEYVDRDNLVQVQFEKDDN